MKSSWRVAHSLHLTNEILEATTLARFGLSVRCIAERTGLTEGQVRYRLHQSQVRLSDYREGRSDIAALVIAGTTRFTAGQLREKIQRQLLRSYDKLGFAIDI